MKRQELLLAWVFCTLVLSGCGYTMVKKGAPPPAPRRLASDSIAIVSLQQQIDALQARCREDSIRAASPVAQASPPPPNTAADSVLHAQDEEIASLRDQLKRMTEELDRIKRRLANPRG